MFRNIPIYLLESFISAAKSESFDSAAQSLNMTQSSLSKQMILLDELLPQRAFMFLGRKKVLTPFGKALLAALEPRIEKTQQLILQVSKEFLEEENISYTIAGRGELVAPLATGIKLQNQITFKNCSNEEALEMVLNREADLGIVHSGLDSHELVMRPFFQNKFQVIYPLSHFRDGQKMNLSQVLLRLPCLLYKVKDPVFSEACKELKITENAVIVSRIYSHYQTLIKMVEKGLGWSVVPTHLPTGQTIGHHPLSLQVGLKRKFYLCYRKENVHQKWHRQLVHAVNGVQY